MYECRNCGGGLRFDIPSQKIKCDYCNSEFDPYEVTQSRDAEESSDAYGVRVYTCRQCGGEILTTDESITGFCSFCGSSAVLDGRMTQEKRPAHILPFTKTGSDCRASYLKRASRSPYTDPEVKNPEFLEHFRGIYMPYWVYETEVNGHLKIEGTTTETKRKYRYTHYYDLAGDVKAYYNGIAFDASSSFDDEIAEKIAPFDAKEWKEFTPSYLCGFYADTSDVPARTYQEDADRTVGDSLKESFVTAGGFEKCNTDDPKENETKVQQLLNKSNRRSSLALYPVWFSTYRKGDRVAYAIVNGQTGKISADLPVSKKRYLIGCLLLAIPIFALLNMFLITTPANLLALGSLLGFAAAILYARVLREMDQRESHVRDAGWAYGQKDKKNNSKKKEEPQKKNEEPQKKKRKKKKKAKKTIQDWITDIIVWGFLLYVAGSILFGTAYVLGEGPYIYVLELIILGIVAKRVTLPIEKKYPERHIRRDLLLQAAAIVLALLVRVAKPAEDLYYYAGCIVAMVVILLTTLSLIDKYNYLATRPIPAFHNRKGGETGKALLGLALCMMLAGTLAGANETAKAAVIQYSNEETGYQVVLQDDADLLSDQEEELLCETMEKITEYGSVAFVSSSEENVDTVVTAKLYYRNYFETESGTLFFVDMYNRELYIFSDGEVYQTISRGMANTITDNVYRMASAGNYYECAEEVYQELFTLLGGGKVPMPMKYISNALLALILSVLINYLLVRRWNREKAATDRQIMDAVISSCAVSNSTMKKTHTTMERIESSGSSGGGGGGGGGGGSSSGGGGGHSF